MPQGFSEENVDLIRQYSETFHEPYFQWFADRPVEESEIAKDIKRRLKENDPYPASAGYSEETLL